MTSSLKRDIIKSANFQAQRNSHLSTTLKTPKIAYSRKIVLKIVLRQIQTCSLATTSALKNKTVKRESSASINSNFCFNNSHGIGFHPDRSFTGHLLLSCFQLTDHIRGLPNRLKLRTTLNRRNKYHHRKVLLGGFHFNGHT